MYSHTKLNFFLITAITQIGFNAIIICKLDHSQMALAVKGRRADKGGMAGIMTVELAGKY